MPSPRKRTLDALPFADVAAAVSPAKRLASPNRKSQLIHPEPLTAPPEPPDQDLINTVIANLALPAENLQAAIDYSNDKTFSDDPSDSADPSGSQQIKAFAKLAGRNWTYYVKSLRVVIGRSSEPLAGGAGTQGDGQHVDIDLGPAKVVSRLHAIIEYNGQDRVWQIKILGRNGVKIDRVSYKKTNSVVPLSSGNVLDIGGVQVMFVLPDSPPVIADAIKRSLLVDNALISLAGAASNAAGNVVGTNTLSMAPGATVGNTVSNSVINSTNIPAPIEVSASDSRVAPSGAAVKSVASFSGPNGSSGANGANVPKPAKRSSSLGTGNRKGSTSSFAITHSHSESYPKGVAMIARPQVRGLVNVNGVFNQDLSSDEAKDIKPPYSYATMITQAILSNPEGMMSLSDIYDFISTNYSFYRFSKTGWQNSIRHNLSLNKAFEKVPRKINEPGKGMKWKIADSYKEEFMEKFNVANGHNEALQKPGSGSGKSESSNSNSGQQTVGTPSNVKPGNEVLFSSDYSYPGGKFKRGTSVSRTLQLHMEKYQTLPQSSSNSGMSSFAVDKSVGPAAGTATGSGHPQSAAPTSPPSFVYNSSSSTGQIGGMGGTTPGPSVPSSYTSGGINSSGQKFNPETLINFNTPMKLPATTPTKSHSRQVSLDQQDVVEDLKPTNTSAITDTFSALPLDTPSASSVLNFMSPSPTQRFSVVSQVEAYTPDRGSKSGYGVYGKAGSSAGGGTGSGAGSSGSGMAISLTSIPKLQYQHPNSTTPKLEVLQETPKGLAGDRKGLAAIDDNSQLPSSFMPNSSPAFWKFVQLSSTPNRNDFSPTKLRSPAVGEKLGKSGNGERDLDDLKDVDLTKGFKWKK